MHWIWVRNICQSAPNGFQYCSDDSAQGSHTDSSAYRSRFVHEARAHAKSWIVREKAPREGGSSLHQNGSNKRTDHNISTVHSTAARPFSLRHTEPSTGLGACKESDYTSSSKRQRCRNGDATRMRKRQPRRACFAVLWPSKGRKGPKPALGTLKLPQMVNAAYSDEARTLLACQQTVQQTSGQEGAKMDQVVMNE